LSGHEAAAVTDAVVMDWMFWAAAAIFAVSYIFIITEKIHKTVIALVGGSLMLVLGILHQQEAFHVEELGVDWNVIFLLISMMIIINIMRPSGFFEYIAIRSAKLGKGEPFRILVIFATVTAILSALLDNVTTVLLLVPVTLFIADALEVDPIPFLLTEAFASNIGGTATLIGDPPNILIASKAKLSFMDFIVNLTPAIILIFFVFLIVLKVIFGRKLVAEERVKARVMSMKEDEAIKNRPLLNRSLAVLAVVLVGFMFHGMLGYEPATVALFGAGLLLLVTRTEDPHHVLSEVEWPTIFFFIGLFIIVGGVVKVGLIKWMSLQMLDLTHGNMFSTSMLIMWFSAFASAVVDNIPYVATMNPLVIDMANQLWPSHSGTALLHHAELLPVWWSLALGACLGGNGSAIGASANVIVVGLSEKAGRRISFMRFLAYGLPIMVLTVLIATGYVWLRYFLF